MPLVVPRRPRLRERLADEPVGEGVVEPVRDDIGAALDVRSLEERLRGGGHRLRALYEARPDPYSDAGTTTPGSTDAPSAGVPLGPRAGAAERHRLSPLDDPAR